MLANTELASPQPIAKTVEPSTTSGQVRILDAVVPAAIRSKVANAERGETISEGYPYVQKLNRRAYETEKRVLQVELLKLQRWTKQTGARIVLLFEGRDAAGKGGTIKRFMEHLNPRSARAVALGKPSDAEQGQWYFQRYVNHLPTKGEIIFFDRSWYNRAVVEPVMGFCSPSQHHEFLRQVPLFENLLIDDGIHLFKMWFSVSREEQYRRFKSRESDLLKQWKLSPVDTRGLGLWDDYTDAKKSMFMATDTPFAPWTVIRSDDKKRARLNCMRYVLSKFPYPNKNAEALAAIDPRIIGSKEAMYGDEDW